MSDRPTVLVFHKSTDRFSFGATNYSPRRLTNLLGLMDRAGFRLKVTFDDGYAHLAEVLPGLVERFGIRPLVFVPTAYIGRENRWDYTHIVRPSRHLNRDEIRTLDGYGVRFGSHGDRHRDLTALKDGELLAELRHSRGVLEDLVGKPVTEISYPFGRCNERVERGAQLAGYTRGYTMRFPQGGEREMAVGRVAVYGFDTPLSMYFKVSGGWRSRLEAVKGGVVNRLSGGTILLNRLRRMP